jgi:hypothetical protein
VWEDADENLALTLEKAIDGNTAGFDLVIFDPAAIKRLKTKVTEVQLVCAGGNARAAAALGFTIFYSTWKKGHGSNS